MKNKMSLALLLFFLYFLIAGCEVLAPYTQSQYRLPYDYQGTSYDYGRVKSGIKIEDSSRTGSMHDRSSYDHTSYTENSEYSDGLGNQEVSDKDYANNSMRNDNDNAQSKHISSEQITNKANEAFKVRSPSRGNRAESFKSNVEIQAKNNQQGHVSNESVDPRDIAINAEAVYSRKDKYLDDMLKTARSSIRKGQYVVASQHIERILAIDHQYPPAYVELGHLAYLKNNKAKASAMLSKAFMYASQHNNEIYIKYVELLRNKWKL